MLEARTIPDYDPQTILTKVDINDGKCWTWNGHITHHGYGTYGKDNFMAHRIVYELFHTKLEPEISVDHLCKNTKCVNPEHLEAVTLTENVLRSNNPNAVNARKLHCKRGHRFDTENTYTHPKRGTRHCRKCQQITNRLHKRKDN